mmetsp:Transcript_1778/g.2475  ORF Transcript_1778/g.2475 Transcript_1778/m.2475 type:complete len:258 (-) Transcript_1778:354-1127(-)
MGPAGRGQRRGAGAGQGPGNIVPEDLLEGAAAEPGLVDGLDGDLAQEPHPPGRAALGIPLQGGQLHRGGPVRLLLGLLAGVKGPVLVGGVGGATGARRGTQPLQPARARTAQGVCRADGDGSGLEQPVVLDLLPLGPGRQGLLQGQEGQQKHGPAVGRHRQRRQRQGKRSQDGSAGRIVQQAAQQRPHDASRAADDRIQGHAPRGVGVVADFRQISLGHPDVPIQETPQKAEKQGNGIRERKSEADGANGCAYKATQ